MVSAQTYHLSQRSTKFGSQAKTFLTGPPSTLEILRPVNVLQRGRPPRTEVHEHILKLKRKNAICTEINGCIDKYQETENVPNVLPVPFLPFETQLNSTHLDSTRLESTQLGSTRLD